MPSLSSILKARHFINPLASIRICNQSLTIAAGKGGPGHLDQWMPVALFPEELLPVRREGFEFAEVFKVLLGERDDTHLRAGFFLDTDFDFAPDGRLPFPGAAGLGCRALMIPRSGSGTICSAMASGIPNTFFNVFLALSGSSLPSPTAFKISTSCFTPLSPIASIVPGFGGGTGPVTIAAFCVVMSGYSILANTSTGTSVSAPI